MHMGQYPDFSSASPCLPFTPFLPPTAMHPQAASAMMNRIPLSQKGPGNNKPAKEIPDKSKTEIPCDRYLKRFQIWDHEELEYVPYDSSANTSSPAPKEEDKTNYFYIDSRFLTERCTSNVLSVDCVWLLYSWSEGLGDKFQQAVACFLAVCPSPSTIWRRHISILVYSVTVGDDFFRSDPEVLVTSFFPKLSVMRKTLATTKSFVLSDKTRTLEEYLRVMKSVGLNEIDEEDCMFIGTSSILTLITQDSNLVWYDPASQGIDRACRGSHVIPRGTVQTNVCVILNLIPLADAVN